MQCFANDILNSGVAQWLACWAHNPKVRGSKPRSAIQALHTDCPGEIWTGQCVGDMSLFLIVCCFLLLYLF